MKLKIYVFLFISFGLHFFFLTGLSFISTFNSNDTNFVSINLNFSKFKELDAQINQDTTHNNFGSVSSENNLEYSKKLVTEKKIDTAANLYVSAWQRQIESIGNSSFKKYLIHPNPISLRLSATLNSDGELINYKLIKSSGEEILDNVAIEILKMASPFKPFNESMEEFSEITIIRDWNFGAPKI